MSGLGSVIQPLVEKHPHIGGTLTNMVQTGVTEPIDIANAIGAAFRRPEQLLYCLTIHY
jgi:hypothetical protein